MKYLLPFIGVGLVAGAIGLFRHTSRENARLRAVINVLHEGKFDRVSYQVRHVEKSEPETSFDYDWRSDRIRPNTGWRRRTVSEDITVFYFEDGRSFILDGQMEVSFAKGDLVRLLQNGLGERSVVRV